MFRKSMSRGSSKRSFRRGASNVMSRNSSPIPFTRRGGGIRV
ncbi:MAG: hypothetical protein [Microvirus sp.]|nr:MAG: hypothetical protein [Microvirus sp.]